MKQRPTLGIVHGFSLMCALAVAGCPAGGGDAGPDASTDNNQEEDAGTDEDAGETGPVVELRDSGPVISLDAGQQDGGAVGVDAGPPCEGMCGIDINSCTCGASDPCGQRDNGICERQVCLELTGVAYDDPNDCEAPPEDGGVGGGGDDAGAQDGGSDAAVGLTLTLTNIPTLGPYQRYELFFLTPAGAVSVERFLVITENPPPLSFPDVVVPADATGVLLTIEPAQGDAPEPSATRILAGDVGAATVQMTATHASALGTDFAGATASYTLRVPSSTEADPNTQGIWFDTDVALPPAPPGWRYEGFVTVVAGTTASTGRFTSATGADSDGAGPSSGAGTGDVMPGQDFIDPPLDLVGGAVRITLEPADDGDAWPYLTLLVDDMEDVATQAMTLDVTLPTATLTIGQ